MVVKRTRYTLKYGTRWYTLERYTILRHRLKLRPTNVRSKLTPPSSSSHRAPNTNTDRIIDTNTQLNTNTKNPTKNLYGIAMCET